MKKLIFVVAVLSFLTGDALAENRTKRGDAKLTREAACKGEGTTQAQRIAKYSHMVSRRGDELLFRLKNGTVVSRKSTPPDSWVGYRDCNGNVNVNYKFHDFIDPWYVIGEGYYEGYGVQFLNRDTGATETVYGYPEFSPDKRRFLAIGYPGEIPCDVQIWELSRAGPVREWVLQGSGGYSYRWPDRLTFEISTEDKMVIARMRRRGSVWRCSGTPNVCDPDKVVTPRESRPGGRFDEKDGRTIEEKDSRRSALASAASENDVQEVERLLKKGLNINSTDVDGWSALERASYDGYPDVVKLLLAKGAPVNSKKYLNPPVMLAVLGGHLDVVNLLLDNRANVNAEGADGRTPLMLAAWGGSTEMVKLLLSRGANVNLRDDRCCTALNGDRTVTGEVLKLLIANGAEVNARDREGKTALMKAASGDNLELVKVLLDNGADVNTKSERSETALMEAAVHGRMDLVKMLLAKGADVNIKDESGTKAYTMAAGRGHRDIAAMLLERRAAANAKDEDGVTAVMEAAGAGYLDVVRALLEKGADVRAKDRYGWNALTWAADGGNMEEVRLLKERGAELTLTAAACLADLTAVQRCIRDGADVNAKGANGRTPLMEAARLDHLEVLKVLLGKGADTNAKDKHGLSALIGAATGGHLEAVRLLLQNGADVNTKAENGRTALMGAAKRGHSEVVRVLLENGADVNPRGEYCQTALDLAMCAQNMEIVEILRARGAKDKDPSD